MGEQERTPELWDFTKIEANHNLVVPAMLTSAYIYYIRGHDMAPIMKDTDFDKCCKLLRRHWRTITHVHKSLIQFSDLSAGTLFRLREHDYPNMCKGCAVQMSMGTILLKHNEKEAAVGLKHSTSRQLPTRTRSKSRRKGQTHGFIKG